jgi:hypothetical protein
MTIVPAAGEGRPFIRVYPDAIVSLGLDDGPAG